MQGELLILTSLIGFIMPKSYRKTNLMWSDPKSDATKLKIKSSYSVLRINWLVVFIFGKLKFHLVVIFIRVVTKTKQNLTEGHCIVWIRSLQIPNTSLSIEATLCEGSNSNRVSQFKTLQYFKNIPITTAQVIPLRLVESNMKAK